MTRAFSTQLLDPDSFPHPVESLQILETHISWVILTGTFAYKFKKPVDFGFVDFSSQRKRLHACREELRLNGRSAPGMYLSLVALVEQGEKVAIVDADTVTSGSAVIDYGIRMHEFPQSAQMDRQFEAGRVSAEDMDRIAASLAALHRDAAVAGPAEPWGEPDAVAAPARENFRHLRELRVCADRRAQIESLENWCESEFGRRARAFAERKRCGFVRECHGDLHLSNLVRTATSIQAFDCIEFNPALRWIDVLSDAAFLQMDLAVRVRDDLAFRFLNTYLENTGDYAGLGVLKFYLAYRSVVRAKVAALQAESAGPDDPVRDVLVTRLQRHLDYASSVADSEPPPRLFLMHGLSGSGKTSVSRRLMERLPAIRVRSDVERKRLHGLAAEDDSRSGTGSGIYTESATRESYAHLLACAKAILDGGFNAIVDAAFLREWQRAKFRRMAEATGVDCIVVFCTAPETVLRQRVRDRNAARSDASEADIGVLEKQISEAEPPPARGAENVLVVDTSLEYDVQELCARLRAR